MGRDAVRGHRAAAADALRERPPAPSACSFPANRFTAVSSETAEPVDQHGSDDVGLVRRGEHARDVRLARRHRLRERAELLPVPPRRLAGGQALEQGGEHLPDALQRNPPLAGAGGRRSSEGCGDAKVHVAPLLLRQEAVRQPSSHTMCDPSLFLSLARGWLTPCHGPGCGSCEYQKKQSHQGEPGQRATSAASDQQILSHLKAAADTAINGVNTAQGQRPVAEPAGVVPSKATQLQQLARLLPRDGGGSAGGGAEVQVSHHQGQGLDALTSVSSLLGQSGPTAGPSAFAVQPPLPGRASPLETLSVESVAAEYGVPPPKRRRHRAESMGVEGAGYLSPRICSCGIDFDTCGGVAGPECGRAQLAGRPPPSAPTDRKQDVAPPSGPAGAPLQPTGPHTAQARPEEAARSTAYRK